MMQLGQCRGHWPTMPLDFLVLGAGFQQEGREAKPHRIGDSVEDLVGREVLPKTSG